MSDNKTTIYEIKTKNGKTRLYRNYHYLHTDLLMIVVATYLIPSSMSFDKFRHLSREKRLEFRLELTKPENGAICQKCEIKIINDKSSIIA